MTKHVLEVRQTGRTALGRALELMIAAQTLNLDWTAINMRDDNNRPLIVIEIKDGKDEELHSKPGGGG